MTETKHVLLPLRIGSGNPAIKADCESALPTWTPIWSDCVGFALGGVVALVADREHAEQIVRAVNCHDELVEALRKLREDVITFNRQRSIGLFVPSYPDKVEDILAKATDTKG